MNRLHSPFYHAASLSCLGCGLALLIGCSGGGPKETNNTVKGAVTVKGSPSANGTITFHGAKDVGGAIINGTYKVDDPPIGQVKVSLRVLPTVGAPADKGKAPTADKGDILAGGASGAVPNKKYESAESSGLTYDVKAGKHVKDFDLEP